ncbi:hypothetical protein VIGAN_11156000 [Vigna angularis var. angularis]|uniref:Uncharacterized protein n=1 Tax=Vigna angularis var. angularis TaxID=157739 RepID=A0A0S3TA98_PHAAN|nr:hypothetical protein VIGAN_11156000 [Vigna angularis var. angularis]
MEMEKPHSIRKEASFGVEMKKAPRPHEKQITRSSKRERGGQQPPSIASEAVLEDLATQPHCPSYAASSIPRRPISSLDNGSLQLSHPPPSSAHNTGKRYKKKGSTIDGRSLSSPFVQDARPYLGRSSSLRTLVLAPRCLHLLRTFVHALLVHDARPFSSLPRSLRTFVLALLAQGARPHSLLPRSLGLPSLRTFVLAPRYLRLRTLVRYRTVPFLLRTLVLSPIPPISSSLVHSPGPNVFSITKKVMTTCFPKLCCGLLLLLLPAAQSILGFNNSAEIKCIERERQALLNFKHGLIDVHDMLLSTWRDDDNSRDCCKWKGIQCDHQTGHVTILRLRGSDTQYLRGALNITSLFPLQNIQHLDLSYNEFIESHIPELMGSVTNLRYLNLSYSSFGGNIPTQLGSLSHLLSLDLSNNYFLRGDIPYQLVSLTNLRYLDLSYNNLDGKIPCQLGNMSQLRYLGLSANSFSGALPFQVGNLPYLQTLRLPGDFDVKPKDAHWLSNISSLTHLAIDGLHNPDWLHMIHYPKLGELRLVNCSLSDTHIHSLFYSPSNFSNSLTILDLSYNMLTSSTFQLLSNFSRNLQELYLSHNNIVLSSPVHSTFPSLVILDLSYNNMSSSVFRGIFNFSSKLQNLYLQNCSLGDDIFLMSAISITNSSSSLASLDLSSNLLKSSYIFYWLFNSTTNLRKLELNDNMLEGPIPDGFGKVMNSLEELYLSHNNIVLSSPVHSTFPSLVILDLSYNNMSSSVFQGIFNSSSKLQNLYLRNCSLRDDSFLMSAISITNSSSSHVLLYLSSNLLKSSSIFYWLFNSTTNLRTLELYDNMLEGPIPDGFGKVMNSLEVLDLYDNKLGGEIPSFFGNMCTLQRLDLSNNKLSGNISSFIQNSSRCNKQVFQSLSLSDNQITGILPISIGLLSELEDTTKKKGITEGQKPSETAQNRR